MSASCQPCIFSQYLRKRFRALFPPSGRGSGVCADYFRAGGAAWMGAGTCTVALLANMQLKTAAIVLVSGLWRFALRNATFHRAKRHISPCKTRRFALQNATFRNSLTARVLYDLRHIAVFNIFVLNQNCALVPKRFHHIVAQNGNQPCRICSRLRRDKVKDKTPPTRQKHLECYGKRPKQKRSRKPEPGIVVALCCSLKCDAGWRNVELPAISKVAVCLPVNISRQILQEASTEH